MTKYFCYKDRLNHKGLKTSSKHKNFNYKNVAKNFIHQKISPFGVINLLFFISSKFKLY